LVSAWSLQVAFGHDGSGPDSIPRSEDACNAITDGFEAVWNHPGMLVHSDEWSSDWQYALGLTLIDVGSLLLPGIGKIGGVVGGTTKQVTAALAKAPSENLAAGIVKYGATVIKNSVEKLGAINAAKLLELTIATPIKFTFKPLEIRAIALSIEIRGFDAVGPDPAPSHRRRAPAAGVGIDLHRRRSVDCNRSSLQEACAASLIPASGGTGAAGRLRQARRRAPEPAIAHATVYVRLPMGVPDSVRPAVAAR
jgi:hypothetical protein